jgi:hypothetical protein
MQAGGMKDSRQRGICRKKKRRPRDRKTAEKNET